MLTWRLVENINSFNNSSLNSLVMHYLCSKFVHIRTANVLAYVDLETDYTCTFLRTVSCFVQIANVGNLRSWRMYSWAVHTGKRYHAMHAVIDLQIPGDHLKFEWIAYRRLQSRSAFGRLSIDIDKWVEVVGQSTEGTVGNKFSIAARALWLSTCVDNLRNRPMCSWAVHKAELSCYAHSHWPASSAIPLKSLSVWLLKGCKVCSADCRLTLALINKRWIFVSQLTDC